MHVARLAARYDRPGGQPDVERGVYCSEVLEHLGKQPRLARRHASGIYRQRHNRHACLLGELSADGREMPLLENLLPRALREDEKASALGYALATDVEERKQVRLWILAPDADKTHVRRRLLQERQMRERRLCDDAERPVSQKHGRQQYRLQR